MTVTLLPTKGWLWYPLILVSNYQTPTRKYITVKIFPACKQRFRSGIGMPRCFIILGIFLLVSVRS